MLNNLLKFENKTLPNFIGIKILIGDNLELQMISKELTTKQWDGWWGA